ncbi:MAG: hypothetical protein H6865_01825 [Rhodospirillales bacterium]|nr:hypothetical protein [Alphaproteobacteria bacterium]MCB9986357.1 hypothetical protein [Rhodospirillales bacterium]USO07094.1 MAG: hypothetical protein H6866_06560 [Rhodospirillales bacterium]
MPFTKTRCTASSATLARIVQARDAIRSHDYAALNGLLAAGLNPNIPAPDGRYLVHDAILFDASGTSIDLLVHYHANLDARWTQYLNWTPAHVAWFAGRADIVEKLRRLGADIELEDTRGWSARRAMPCPITQIEGQLKFGALSMLVGHTTERPIFNSGHIA